MSICKASRCMAFFALIASWCLSGSISVLAQVVAIPLDGMWQVVLPDNPASHQVAVPTALEDAIRADVDGISVWSRIFPPAVIPANERLFLCFDAVATRATVRFNGTLVGEHLGAWTPFEFEVTELARKGNEKELWTVEVTVDELVGHNTQGFLPVVTSHFGGIWQSVRLEKRPKAFVDRRTALVKGSANHVGAGPSLSIGISASVGSIDPSTLSLDLAIRRLSGQAAESDGLGHSLQGDDQDGWRSLGRLEPAESDSIAGQLVFSGNMAAGPVELWSPPHPVLYEIRALLGSQADGSVLDQAIFRTGFSDFTTEGPQLRLNGQPLSVRGVLNWGYAPPRIAPSLDEAWMRNEIEFARSRGFNLMKFCLWVPPQRYLELCDELGMLAWVEYPTWHPKLDAAHRGDLLREYCEFFHFDRNHPSIALRSLTCETGPSADLAVVRGLYETGKSMIPGALIEDDSSWIEWNRVADFYDDHPYGNNHTWLMNLDRLKAFIAERDSKPLVLGEAIAADTWNVDDPWSESDPFARQAHSPWAAEANRSWRDQMRLAGEPWGVAVDADCLALTSLQYAMAMRKFQIELFRREVPDGGYVVSVLRDFPKASMGLIDFANRPKSGPSEWEFHGQQMLLLTTPGDRRGFFAGRSHSMTVGVAGVSGPLAKGAELSWKLTDEHGLIVQSAVQPLNNGKSGGTSGLPGCSLNLKVDRLLVEPERFTLSAALENSAVPTRNAWTLWFFPGDGNKSTEKVPNRESFLIDARMAASNLPTGLGDLERRSERPVPGKAWVCEQIDEVVLEFLVAGGRALLIPNGKPGSLAVEQHWFLRGGPAVFEELKPEDLPESSAESPGPRPKSVRRHVLEQLQHFDLAGPVIPQMDGWLNKTLPRIVLWDNHDLRECRTHGLWIDLPVGVRGGRLSVSTLQLGGAENAAGDWMFLELIRELHREANFLSGAEKNGLGIGEGNEVLIRDNLHRRELDLAANEWSFRPLEASTTLRIDSQTKLAELAGREGPEWRTIRIGEHWDGQGFASHDGWGLYRSELVLPEDWPDDCSWLVFDGVDDCCVIWINGQLAGKCGDAESRTSAFEVRSVVPVKLLLQPGKANEIVIAVFDWQGAGGLFRSVRLGTTDPTHAQQIFLPLSQ